jgi:predicted N-acetyltransferase YhbS
LSDNDFTFQHLETEKDIEEYLEIIRKVFGQNTGVGVFIGKLVYDHPKMALRNHFIAKYHGRVIAGLSLIPIQLSIGGILLKVSEMGNVATLEEYRRKGLIRRLLNEYQRTRVNRRPEDRTLILRGNRHRLSGNPSNSELSKGD